MARMRVLPFSALAVLFLCHALDVVSCGPVNEVVESRVAVADSGPVIVSVDVKVLPGTGLKEAEPAAPATVQGPIKQVVDAGSTTVPPPPVPTRPDCIMMYGRDVRHYKDAGCTLTKVAEDCYEKPVCPQVCTAEDNATKEIDGPMWPEQDGDKMCECVGIGAIVFSPPVPPPGAGPFPPTKHCRPNGCLIHGVDNETDVLIQPGRQHDFDGTTCTCVSGPDPGLMDYATLYHFQCDTTTDKPTVLLPTALPAIVEDTKKATVPPPPVPTRPDCIMMHGGDIRRYKDAGCNLNEVEEGCYEKPVCPEVCTAEDNSTKEIDGPMWPEQDGNKMCECVRIGAILFSPPVPPPGAGPFPPIKHCRSNGCLIHGVGNETDVLIQPGRQHDFDGTTCTCVSGPDPGLADYATLYHFQCNRVTIPPPVPTGPDCTWMSRQDVRNFKELGCNVTKIRKGCYEKPVCPEDCTAEDNSTKEIDGPMWPEQDGDKMCECVRIGAILFSPPVPPPGAGPFPPIKHCRSNGCLIHGVDNETDVLIQPGNQHEMYGRTCTCVSGPDPDLMDYSTLYHFQCESITLRPTSAQTTVSPLTPELRQPTKASEEDHKETTPSPDLAY